MVQLFLGHVLRLPRVDGLLAGAEPLLRRSRDRLTHCHPQPRNELQRGEVGQRGLVLFNRKEFGIFETH